ncbi:MAG: hypothetical protein AAF798_19120 [Bacteroidota bacterium]
MKSQEYQVMLSVGYVYIVILGIVKEALYYGQVGIDYFQYATITDILISPISDIARNTTTLTIFGGFLILTFLLPGWLAKQKDKKWVQSSFSIDPSSEPKAIQSYLSRVCIIMLCVGLMGFYVGRGIGNGSKVSKKINEGSIEFEDKLSLTNGETEAIFLIGKNSSFLFYIAEGKEEIEVSSINSGWLKSIIENR